MQFHYFVETLKHDQIRFEFDSIRLALFHELVVGEQLVQHAAKRRNILAT